MSGGSGSHHRVLPAGLSAHIHSKRLNPQTYVPGRFVTDSDLLDLSDIEGRWDHPVVSVHFVCSWSVPQLAGGTFIPSQLATNGSSGLPGTPNRRGAVGQLPPQSAIAPPGRVMGPPTWLIQMPMQMPPMQFSAHPGTVGAQTQIPMQPQYGVSPLMHHPSEMHMQTQAMYGQMQAMYGQTQAMYGQTQAMYGQPQAMYGQMQVPLAQTTNPPQMMMGGHDLQRAPAPPAPPFTQSRNAVGPPTDRPVAFHLRLFFQFASGQSSIELHQRSSGMADNKAIATFRNYVVTTHNVFDGCVVPSESLEGFTMAEVKRVVFDKNKRHLYRFVNETGCAYWALEVIGDLEKAQLLKSGAKARCTDQYHEWAVRRRKEDELPYHPAKGEWLPV